LQRVVTEMKYIESVWGKYVQIYGNRLKAAECEILRNRKLSLLVLCARFRLIKSIEIVWAGQAL